MRAAHSSQRGEQPTRNAFRPPHAVMIGEYTLVSDEGTKGGSYHRFGLADGLADALDRFADWFASSGEGVVLLLGPAARALGLPFGARRELFEDEQQAATLDKLAHQCRARGWRVTQIRPWTTFHAKGRPTLHVGILTYLTTQSEYPFADPEISHLYKPYLHRVWRDLTGSSYRGTPGVAGTAILRDVAAGQERQPTWQPAEPGRLGMELPYLLEHWQAPDDHELPFEHGYDVNYMYLSAWSTVEVSGFGLRHTGAIPFDRRRAGWWLADIGPWNHPALPDPAGYSGDPHPGPRWVTSPTLSLLEDLTAQGMHGGFTIADSWTGPAARSVLMPTAEKIRDALYLLDAIDVDDLEIDVKVRSVCPVLIRTLKDAYRQAHGLLNREGGRAYRPDWYSAIVAQARANLFRKLYLAWYNHGGRMPLRIDTDKVWYASGVEDPRAAAPPNFKITDDATEHRRLGQFHLGGTRVISRPGGAR